MKKLWILAVAAILCSAMAFANGDKKKAAEKAKKTCVKGGNCCSKTAQAKKS